MSNNPDTATAVTTANSPISSHGNSNKSPSSAQGRSLLPAPPIDRFYGREQEEAILLQLFHHCIGRSSKNDTANGCKRQDCTLPQKPASSFATPLSTTIRTNDLPCQACRSRLVILQGSKGVGKRTLSQRLRSIVQEAGGLYFSVSFSERSRDPRCSTLRFNEDSKGCTVLFHVMELVIHSLSKERWNTLRDEVCRRFFTDPSELQALHEILSTLSGHGVHHGDPQGTQVETEKPARSLGEPDPEAEPFEMIAPKAPPGPPHSAADQRPYAAPLPFECPNHHPSAAVPADSLDSLTSTGSTTTETRNGREIMVRFIVAVATIMPLVVHMDAAHHAQAADLEAVQSLVYPHSDGSPTLVRCGLLLILCRETNTTLSTNDAPASESVAMAASSQGDLQGQREGDHTKPSLDNIHCCGRIQLDNLSRDHIEQWIGNWSNEGKNVHGDNCDGTALAQSRNLTNLVFQRTLGNPQHAHFMLLLFQLEGLRENFVQGGIHQICPDLLSDPYKLFQQIVQRQDPLIQGVIETMAALIECDASVRVTSSILEIVASQPCSQALSVAVESKLLACPQGWYHFTDSLLQSAAYAMMPEPKRSKVHLQIGRRIWKYSSLGGTVAERTSLDTDMLLFTVARQLERGVDVVTDLNERDLIAKIQWEAGKRAMQRSEFSSAATYFECAISILRNARTWRADQYDLNRALHNGAAEAYYCTGDFVRTDHLLEQVF
jgi:hypothetical protein